MQPISDASTFADMRARSFIVRQTRKRFLGRPYIRAGRLFGICAHLFLQAGLVGRAFRSSPGPLVIAFFAPPGRSEDVVAARRQRAALVLVHLDRISNAHALVCVIEMDRRHQQGEWHDWFVRHAMEKVPQERALTLARLYQEEGAGLGIEHPDKVERLFKPTYRIETSDDWHRACEFGAVNIPDCAFLSAEESEHRAVGVFEEYCRRSCPELLRPLGLAG